MGCGWARWAARCWWARSGGGAIRGRSSLAAVAGDDGEENGGGDDGHGQQGSRMMMACRRHHAAVAVCRLGCRAVGGAEPAASRPNPFANVRRPLTLSTSELRLEVARIAHAPVMQDFRLLVGAVTALPLDETPVFWELGWPYSSSRPGRRLR